MTVLAVDGSYASVIGGAPAAAVVFAGDVSRRTAGDPRVRELEEQIAESSDADHAALLARLDDVRGAVLAEKLGEVAGEFDAVHSIERAVRVGSVDAILQPAELRPKLIDAVTRGLEATAVTTAPPPSTPTSDRYPSRILPGRPMQRCAALSRAASRSGIRWRTARWISWRNGTSAGV